jgi:flagellar biosynthesis GTPase FlhF
MARLCSGPSSSYGCGHHEEHVRAARLGWQRRRLGARFAGSRDQASLSRVVGEVQHAHTHPDHRGVVAFRQRGKWYELPRSEYRRLVAVGREQEAHDRREQALRAREEREIARFREMEAKERRQAEMEQRRAERNKQRQQAQLRQVARAERSEVVKLIRQFGGVRLEDARDRGEYALLPAEIRRKDGRFTMDTAREQVDQHMPWLNLATPDDLVQFFERSRTKTMRDRIHRERVTA